MTCKHMKVHLEPHLNVLLNEDGEYQCHVLDIEAHCSGCGTPFLVNWSKCCDPDQYPGDSAEMMSRPWVSFNRTTIGMTLSPLKPKEKLIGPTVGFEGNA